MHLWNNVFYWGLHWAPGSCKPHDTPMFYVLEQIVGLLCLSPPGTSARSLDGMLLSLPLIGKV